MERYDPVRWELWQLGELFGRSRAALARYADHLRLTRAADEAFLRERTIPHVGDMEEAFPWGLRAERAMREEIAYLLRALSAVLPDEAPSAPARRALHLPDARKIGALGHAVVVFGQTPRLPDGAVTTPVGRRTYRDIAPPAGPVDLLDRIRELQATLEAVLSNRPVRAGALRRTYAFFDTGHWLFHDFVAPRRTE